MPIRSFRFLMLVSAFVIFTAIVMSGATSGVDNSANRFFKSLQGSPFLDEVMIIIAILGEVITLLVLAVVLSIMRRTRKVGLIFLISIAILAILVMYLKPLIGRSAPTYGFEPVLTLPQKFDLESDSFAPFATAFSYPSAHASIATALAFIAGYALNKKSRFAGIAIWAFPVITGISRLYVQQHYPTDLLGGFILGMIISLVLSNVMKLDQPLPTTSKIREEEKNDSHV